MKDVQYSGRWNTKGEEREKRKGVVSSPRGGMGLLVEVPKDLREGLFK